MTTEIERPGYRITGIIEPRTITWSNLKVGKNQRNTELRGLFSDKRPKKERFSPKSVILEESEELLEDHAEELATAMEYIHSHKTQTSKEVRAFYDNLKSVKEILRNEGFGPGDVVPAKLVDIINERMNNFTPGDLVKLKIQITRVEEHPFPGARKLENGLFTKTRVQATVYFKSLDDAQTFLKNVVVGEALSGELTDAYNSFDSIVVLGENRKGNLTFNVSKVETDNSDEKENLPTHGLSNQEETLDKVDDLMKTLEKSKEPQKEKSKADDDDITDIFN